MEKHGKIEPGEEVQIEGELTYHKSYGEQLAFTKIEKVLPSDDNTLIEYIAKSKIKGVGEATAKKIITKFGSDSIDVIRYKPEQLLDIKGINDEKAFALSEYINDEWERWNLASFLTKNNIGLNMATRIYDTLGIDAIKIIKENPYALMQFITNLDFKTTDTLAKSLSIEVTHPDRVKAGILYILTYIIREGHTCLDMDKLDEYVSKLLEISEEHIFSAIENLKHDNKIIIERKDDIDYVYLKSIYMAELNIATKTAELTRKTCRNLNFDKVIEKVSDKQSIVLSAEQKDAVSACINNNISIVTGGPGTGKTTIIKCLIDILKEKELTYVLAAPTGRAAKRITETTKEEAKTLHRLLEISKIEDTDIDTYVNYPVATIDANVLIIDEVSMVDTLLMNNVVKAIKEDTKLILVGDIDQLPSVGPGNVLKDIIDSKVVQTIYLTEIYRQSSKSDIIVNAHRVKTGEHIKFKNKDTDLYFIETDSIENTISELESLISHRIKEYYGENVSKDMQVLTPIKKTDIGTFELNKMIQKIHLKPNKDMVHKKFGDRVFYENDKVMQVRNNYDINWEVDGVQGTGVYNGDIGTIERINPKEEYIIVNFDENKKVKYDFDDLEQLEHAYAITVHKSQGSEFNTVIIPIYICYEKLFNRNLIYTAMTRAKSLLIFIGRKKALDYMVDNTNDNARITGLKDKLNEVI